MTTTPGPTTGRCPFCDVSYDLAANGTLPDHRARAASGRLLIQHRCKGSFSHAWQYVGDPLLAAGHPLTCNGGNPDWRTHHDHEVVMQRDDHGLVCPECGRRQELPKSSDGAG